MPYVPVEVDRRKKGEQVKTKYLKVRLSVDELAQAHKLADQRGVTISDLIRSFLFQDGDNANKSR